MSKKDSVFTRVFDLKNILDMITSTALAAQSLFNPTGAIVLTPIIKTLVNIAVDFCDHKKSDCINEVKGLIEGYLSNEPELSTSEIKKHTKLAFECIKAFDVDSFSSVTLHKAKDKIFGEVKKVYPNTNDDTYRILVNAIVYSVAEICYSLKGNEKGFKDYCIKNSIFTLNEIDRLERFCVNLDARMVKLEKKVEGNIRKKIMQCANYFTDALYLHKDTSDFKDTAPEKVVNLKNLFVKQKVESIEKPYGSYGYKEMNIEEYLSSYAIEGCKVTLLIGDAGVGKSSIVYWLADLYLNGEEADKKKIFKDKELVIVRLRDIIEDIGENLYIPTCNFFDCKDDEIRNNLYKDKYVVLDGLDEIRWKNNDVKFEKILNSALECFDDVYRLIITTRPGIEKVVFEGDKKKEKFNNLCIYSIKPFEKKEKKEWIDKYEKVAGKIDEEIIKYINVSEKLESAYNTILNLPISFRKSSANIIEDIDLRDMYEKATGKADEKIIDLFEKTDLAHDIYDYPQILYLVSSANTKDGSWSIDNEWSLYHHIFYEQIMSKKYERHNKGINPEHPFKDNIDDIYLGLERISYGMYLNNFKSRISNEDINILLNKKTTSREKKLLNSYVYRFGCYGKINGNISEFEFYHNDIRDFFIAEYLYDGLNALFSEVVERKKFDNYNSDGIEGYDRYLKFTKGLFELFRYIPIHKKVVDFMISRTKFRNSDTSYKDKFYEFLVKNAFSKINFTEMIEEAPIRNLTQELWCNPQIFEGFDCDVKMSTLQKVSIFYNDYLSIVYALLYCYDEKKIAAILDQDILNSLTGIYSNLNNRLNVFVCLNGAYLRKAYLKNVNLTGAYLVGAHLNGAHLEGADLRNGHLEKADLSGGHLEQANLKGVYFKGAQLVGTHLEGANLWGAHLEGVDLSRAHLKGANFAEVHLDGAIYDIEEIKKAANWEQAIYK